MGSMKFGEVGCGLTMVVVGGGAVAHDGGELVAGMVSVELGGGLAAMRRSS